MTPDDYKRAANERNWAFIIGILFALGFVAFLLLGG